MSVATLFWNGVYDSSKLQTVGIELAALQALAKVAG
jgi:hypothetical protein